MFKLNIPITKSYVEKGSNVLKIEGIATDTTIDRDSERFSEEAIKGMHDSVNAGDIPIKVEHGDNIFSEIGVWKEASFTADGKVFVKGEIDLDLSMGKDIEVLLSKGFEIALSVGGMVMDAISEFNSELGKSIKVYTDILLREISIVKNPANYNATLSLAKSFDMKEKKETLAALSLNEKSLKANSSYGKSIKEIEDLIQSTVSKKDEVFIKGIGEAKIASSEDVEYYDSYSMSELKYLDYKIIGMVYRIYAVIGTDEIKEPEGLDWESEMNLPDYSFLPLTSDSRLIPYMDINLKLRKDWIIYSMYRLAKGEYSWLKAEDRSYAMEFLYSAYKQLISTSKSFKVEAGNVRDIRNDEVDLMKNCIKYKVEKGTRPQYDGNDLSDVEINKLAKAYSVLIERNILKTNSNNTMNKAELEVLIKNYTDQLEALNKNTDEAPVDEVPVVEEKVEEEVPAVDTPVEKDAPVVEEKTEEEVPAVEVKEEVVAEDAPVVDDANVDATKNKTNIDEALLKAISAIVETANKDTVKSISALEESTNEKIEAIKTANAEAMTKSATKNTDAATANTELMEKMAGAIETLVGQVDVIGKSKGDRKSFATSIAKGFTDKSASKSTEELITAEMEKNGNSYANARTAVLGAA